MPLPTTTAGEGLYPRILGGQWAQLAAPVRQLHSTGTAVAANGRFQVRHGEGLFARVLAPLLRLPRECDSTEVNLLVTADGGAERWRRDFDGVVLATLQTRGDDGQLQERAGPVLFRFALALDAGGLVYGQVGVALQLGPLRVPLPSWAVPNVVAQEHPQGDGVRVSVAVTLPFGGLLLSYGGEVITHELRQ